jgi:hypothetical protein
MTIMDRFINRYVALRYLQNESSREFTKKAWSLSKDEIIIYLESGDEEIDLLWDYSVFSLFSKTIYFFSPENYKYCNDFIQWKYEYYNILPKIYKGKFKNFIDDSIKLVPTILQDKFNNYSKDKIDEYSNYLLSIFDLFNNECCNLDYKQLLNEVKENDFFKEEFSICTNDLSNIFLKSLLKQISI